MSDVTNECCRCRKVDDSLETLTSKIKKQINAYKTLQSLDPQLSPGILIRNLERLIDSQNETKAGESITNGLSTGEGESSREIDGDDTGGSRADVITESGLSLHQMGLVAQEKLACIAKNLEKTLDVEITLPKKANGITSSSSSSTSSGNSYHHHHHVQQQHTISKYTSKKMKLNKTVTECKEDDEDDEDNNQLDLSVTDICSETSSPAPAPPSTATSTTSMSSCHKRNNSRRETNSNSGSSNIQPISIKCGYCSSTGEIFYDKQTVLTHILKFHPEVKHKIPRYRCSECPKITEKYTAFRAHAYRHRMAGTHFCTHLNCTKSYPLKSMLDAHQLSKHCPNASGKAFSCKSCGKRFHTKTGLAGHITTKHVEELPSRVSPRPGLKDGNLSDSSLPDCAVDGDDSMSIDMDENLSNTNDNNIPERRVTRESITNTSHHSSSSSPSKGMPKLPVFVTPSTQDEDKDYEREMQQFRKFPTLPTSDSNVSQQKQHGCELEKGNISSSSSSKKLNSNEWNCNLCNNEVSTTGHHHHHHSNHHNPKSRRHHCNTCDASYLQKSTLDHHKKVHHINPPPPPLQLPSPLPMKKFRCQVCAMEFHDSKCLTQHEKIHAEPSLEFQCSICNKSYKSRRCLRRHVQLHTTTNKKYICTLCTKAFRVKSKLDEHENSHTGRRPLGCQFCDKTFNGHPNYVKHIRRKHPSSIRENKIPPPKKMENSSITLSKVIISPPTLATSSSTNPTVVTTINQTIQHSSAEASNSSSSTTSLPILIPIPAHNANSIEYQQSHNHGQSQHASQQQQQQQQQPLQNNWHSNNNNMSGKNYLNPSGGNLSSSATSMNAMDLVDCAIQNALVGNGHENNSSSTNATNSHYDHNNEQPQLQNEPMELSYKLESSSFQEMPMELTKVFQRDPLELCVPRLGQQDLNQLMDLSSRVDTSGIVGMGGVSVHKLDLTERELMDLSGAFRQPIDLISRVDDSAHDLYNEGSLVDLSLRSNFGQDQSASSFLRELIDLSSRSDSFHGELDLTKPHHHHSHQPQHSSNNNNIHLHHHPSSTIHNSHATTNGISPKNSTSGNNVGSSLQHVVYQEVDTMFGLQN